jgi:Protein of unknown function (DUF2905)
MNGLAPAQIGKLLIVAGIVFVAVGLLVMGGGRFSFFGFGRLPGDIAYRGKHGSFYFPIVTCLVLSAIATLALWVISFLMRR